jgi:hypothetical protein
MFLLAWTNGLKTINSHSILTEQTCTNNKTSFNLNEDYDNKSIEEVETTKFLGLQINSDLNWKAHIQ